jgi:hypothetical protein
MARLLITIGAILAPTLSWITNHSVGWAILHFFCGWLYIVYWAIAHSVVYAWLQLIAR